MSLAQTAGLPQAGVALPKFDQFIPLAQRQQVLRSPNRLQPKQKRRAIARSLLLALEQPLFHQLRAAADSGLATGSDPGTGKCGCGCATGRERANPRIAGADYARPRVIAQPPAPKPASVVASAPPKPVVLAPSKPRPTISAPSTANNGSWRIQFGAFGVNANADAYGPSSRSRLNLPGTPGSMPPPVSVIKLQAGGFSEEAARSTCGKLTAAGFTCVPVRN